MRWRPSQTPAAAAAAGRPELYPANPAAERARQRRRCRPPLKTSRRRQLDLAAARPSSLVPKEEAVAPAPAAEDLMVSLEEEMAKLLGRASDKP